MEQFRIEIVMEYVHFGLINNANIETVKFYNFALNEWRIKRCERIFKPPIEYPDMAYCNSQTR